MGMGGRLLGLAASAQQKCGGGASKKDCRTVVVDLHRVLIATVGKIPPTVSADSNEYRQGQEGGRGGDFLSKVHSCLREIVGGWALGVKGGGVGRIGRIGLIGR